MAITYHSGERIQATAADFAGTPAISGGWKELARTTLGSSGDTIDITSLPDKRYYMVLTDIIASGTVGIRHRLGNSSIDTGSNYAIRSSYNGGSDGSWASSDYMYGSSGSTSVGMFNIEYIANKSDKEKLQQNWNVVNSATGAGTAPNRSENVGKWANTSNVIDTLRQYNALGGDFNTGSEVVVLGWDPADEHTSNFWEELGEITIGAAAATMTSSTFTAKKYLWVQGYLKPDGTDTITPTLQLGSTTIDTGANYATRYSFNGGADGTNTSGDTMDYLYNTGAKGEPIFFNTFIINNASNEKLSITHVVAQEAAGNTSDPERSEGVGKWSNTSNQADILKIDQWSGTGNFSTDSIVKIWGSN